MIWLTGTLLLAAATLQAAPLRHEVLDAFREADAWTATASDQVRARLRRDGDGSLCLDYDFAGVSGYAVMRRALPVNWPSNFELAARLKGSGGRNDLQVKLVDASGDNVWWVNRPNQALPPVLTDLKFRRRHIEFAWGPAANHQLQSTQFVELVIAAGRDGGKGSLCVAKLTLTERLPDPASWPEPIVTGDARSLDIDFQHPREFNGVALRWPAGVEALDYDLLASDDARHWRTLRRVRGSDGGLDALFLPESEARLLRIVLQRAGGRPAGEWPGGARPVVELRSSAQWPHFNALLAELAADAPRGDLPRAFLGEQNYWTLVSVDGGGQRSGLLSEDGALEVGRGGFSVEPVVVLDDGVRVTWAQARLTQRLRDGYLPIPAVRWEHASFALEIEAAADGPRDAPELLARYVLRNTGNRPRTFTLLLAVRPWQVNPPQQFLATPGGASPIGELRWSGGGLSVDGRPALQPTAAPWRVSALPFDGGVSLAALQTAPALTTLRDAQAQASAALQFRVTLAPGAARTIGWVAPLGARASGSTAPLDTRFEAVAARWRDRLNHVHLALPAEAQPIADTLRSALAQILMSRDGPALRPGTRSYARTWVRDGAMMVAGLVRLGEIDAAREFVDWFAAHIFASGKVPCCVDQRGADPVVENDSHGQYLYAVAEVWRHSHDAAFLARHWPRVQRVIAWQERLRQSERVGANRRPERAHLFGLMPPSISHEGYSDKPAYSYWDDFWALRGYKDAVLIAQGLGRDVEAARWAAWRDEFTRELVASIAAAARQHRIGFIPGAADRGDFDATSTTMALNPAQAQDVLPRELLAATFERYWQEAQARAEGRRDWKDYTPYELRTAGALVRMGQPERAHAMLRFFFADQRPAGWNQWAEVVMRRYREVHFLGDMPHAWVSSDYIRSALDLFAYEREADDALVVGAGLKPEWLRQGDIEVRGLSTPYGRLDYRLTRNDIGWTFELGPGLSATRGGVRLVWPGEGPLPKATLDGRALAWEGRELPIPGAPAKVILLGR